jgi:hypothetical protein
VQRWKRVGRNAPEAESIVIINLGYIKKSFWNLAGFGDVPDSVKPETVVYGDIPNKNDRINRVIATYVIPYTEAWDEASLLKLKIAMQYLLTFDTDQIRLLFNAVLPPCDAPEPPSLLLEWMMDALFPGEAYINTDLANVEITNEWSDLGVRVDQNAKIPSPFPGEDFRNVNH